MSDNEIVFTPQQEEHVQQLIADAVEKALDKAMRKQGKLAAESSANAMLNELTRNRKERYDKRLRNTKLLLRNYRMLKQHIESAVYDSSKPEQTTTEDYYQIMNSFGNEHQYIESIRKSVRRTRLIMAHIDTMLEVFRIYCDQSGKPELPRHYRVIKALYLDEEQTGAQEVADAENIDKRTIYKDVDNAVEILTPLFFGVDGIKTEF